MPSQEGTASDLPPEDHDHRLQAEAFDLKAVNETLSRMQWLLSDRR
jgi:hypothetical protein